MTNWEEIRKEFEETNITLKDLADKHGIKPATLRSRKNREKWEQRNETKKKATRNATQPKNVATKKAIEEISENDSLTEKQKLFCLYYSQSFNATKSYQKAYGCAYSTALTEGPGALRNPRIREEITRIKEARAKDFLVSDQDIMQEFIKQAFADMTDFVEFGMKEVKEFDEDTGGTVTRIKPRVDLKEDHEVDGKLIKKVMYGRNGVEVELHDKQKAMTELLKYIGADDGIKKQMLQLQLEKMQLELEKLRTEVHGEGEEDGEEDGFLNAIDQSLEAVWGDADGE